MSSGGTANANGADAARVDAEVVNDGALTFLGGACDCRWQLVARSSPTIAQIATDVLRRVRDERSFARISQRLPATPMDHAGRREFPRRDTGPAPSTSMSWQPNPFDGAPLF
jgi:hypothetical protein